MMARTIAVAFVLSCGVLASPLVPASALAEDTAVAVGDRLAKIELDDQHGNRGRIDEATALVIFTRDMDAGDIVREALGEDGAPALARARAVYLSDISAMPSLIFKMFAGPKMRKRSYPMLLDHDGDATAALPSNEGQVTLIGLDALRIASIAYARDVEGLRTALDSSATDERP